MTQFIIGLLVVGFVIVSVMMMLVVLIQRPTGGGLSGAFGAASEGAGQTAFGARTGDALTTATIVIFLLFLGFAIGLNYVVEGPSAAPAAQAAPAAGEEASDEDAGATDEGAGAVDEGAGDEGSTPAEGAGGDDGAPAAGGETPATDGEPVPETGGTGGGE